MTGWRERDIPDLTGKRAVVTGANSGVGFYTALELARAGAAVVVAARNGARGDEAVRRIRAEVASADVELSLLDLADLASVRRFASSYGDLPLDILVNNAGVMALPALRTADGFEMQFGTNHLGHFALTGLLLRSLTRRPGARVVTVSSVAHWMGSIDHDNLMGDDGYQPWTAYAQSKLANLLFMRELNRRAREAEINLISAAAHPGLAGTNLYAVAPQMTGRRLALGLRPIIRLVGQSAPNGALPQLYAATAPDVRGGDYFGPRGPAEFRGRPKRVRMSKNAQDDATARLLWEASERLTGVRYDLAAPG